MLKDTAPITCDNRVSEEPSGFSSDGTHAHEICSSPVFRSNLTTVLTGLLKKAACPFSPPSGSKPPEQKDIQAPSSLQITMLLQPMGQENKETQIRFKMQKDGEPVWDQTTIDRLWVTTQREAMIESGPPPAETAPASNPPVKTEPASKAAPSKAKAK